MSTELLVAPFLAFIDEWSDRHGSPYARLARAWETSEDSAMRRVHRWRHENVSGRADRDAIEDALDAFDRFAWEIYDDLPAIDVGDLGDGRRRDCRGRLLEKPRGVPSRLTDAQIRAAHRLHTVQGLSLRELGRRGWQVWGYASPKSATMGLVSGMQRLGLPRRDRIEAAVKASTIHGKARDPEHRAKLRRATGEVADRPRCAGVRLQYPRKGQPCSLRAQLGSDYCRLHDPEKREDVVATVTAARDRLRAVAA